MELQYYETIRETGHLQVRFEPVLSPAGVFPAHWHEYVEILYIKNGVLSAIVQTVEYELHTGDLMIINSGDLHMTRTPGCHYLILQISARQLRSYLPDFDQLRFDTLIPYTKSRQNTQLFSAIMSCCSPQDYMNFYIFSVGITAPLPLPLSQPTLIVTGCGSPVPCNGSGNIIRKI